MSSITIALPSKGRMKTAADGYMAELGLHIQAKNGERGYHDALEDWPNVAVKRLPASLIAEACLAGEAHFGVTGLDLIAEYDQNYTQSVDALAALDFGHADLIIAVPNFWLDVDYVSDLPRLGEQIRARLNRRVKVATKYQNLTAQFFETHGFVDYQLIDSQGATEAAPANNVADLIVDITSSGATLKANSLKVLTDGLILKTQAQLWRSNASDWHDDALAFSRFVTEKLAEKT